MADPLIGVVTVTFNSSAVISGFMNSLLKQTYRDFVLYMIDNASSDDTLARLADYEDPRIVVIPNSSNLGIAEGNNVGIRAALKDQCASVLLINNDTEFDCSLLSDLSIGLAKNKCDMVVPKILYFDEPHKIWCAGGYFSTVRGATRHYGFNSTDRGQFDEPRAVNYSPTCCMLINKDVFSRVGLMDANYFVYFDDTDFCHRAYRRKIKLFYIPSTRLLHKVSSLTGSDSDFSAHYCIRNHVYYILKHFPARRILLLPIYQLYLIAKSIIPLHRKRGLRFSQRAFWEGIALFRSKGPQRT
jgi:GT2 family glycosyltransferase